MPVKSQTQPGEMYDKDVQCDQVFGKGSTICPFMVRFGIYIVWNTFYLNFFNRLTFAEFYLVGTCEQVLTCLCGTLQMYATNK